MPTKYNWSQIQSGEAFQSLANTLLQFEMPGTRVFGRSGKDSGQDARSADNKTIYQYKHHSAPTFAKVLGDVRGELTKTIKYKQPTDPRYVHWKHAQEWVLVTNVTVNPNDTARWDAEIVPAFATLGLKATLWSIERLEALLTKHPHVAEAYFEGQNRCFLSLGEAYEFTKADEIGDSGSKVALLGRDAELSIADAFLRSTKRVLWMHGPGGIGKSRLLLEIGAEAEAAGNQVLWAAEATMSRSTHWFSAVNYNLPTVLLLDEPQDPDLIRAVAEQVRMPNSQMRAWKVVIAVRSPNDPVLQAVTGLSTHLREGPLVLAPLTPEISTQLALELIATSTLSGLQPDEKGNIADHLSRVSDRFPIWIAIAVNILAKHGNLKNLPRNADEIARKYVDEVIDRSISRSCTQPQLQDILRWVALYEELDIEEAPLASFVSQQAGFADESRFFECLNSLVTRRVVVRRGVNKRLYSIKPDVVREFVVREWLTLSADNKLEATIAAKNLVGLMVSGVDGKPLPRVQLLVRGLARTEFASNLQGTKLELLGPLVRELTRIAAQGTVLEQQGILSFLGSFDFARLGDVLEIVRTIRLTERPAQEYSDFFGHKHRVTHRGVVAQLAWPLFNAARYSRSETERAAVLEEMVALSVLEVRNAELFRNDGKRADALIPRMISGENDWYSGFKDTAHEKVLSLLAKLRDPGGLDDATLHLLKVLCEPFLSIEQERTSYKQNSVTVSRWFIALNSPDGKTRNAIRTIIRETLEGRSAPSQCRLLCWTLLSSAHASANRALQRRGKDSCIPPEYVATIKEDIKADLTWTVAVLRDTTLEIRELRAARGLWEWHYKFQEDQEIRELAVQCEHSYKCNPLAETFHVLFSFDQYEEAEKKTEEIGSTIGTTGTRDSISLFLQQVQEFAPAVSDFGNILPVAQHAAAHWETNSELASFTHLALASHAEGLSFAFAITLLNRRLRTLRESNRPDALRFELERALKATPSADSKAKLLMSLYCRPHPLITGVLTVTDLDFAIVVSNTLGTAVKPPRRCQIFTGMHHTDWTIAKRRCDETYRAASEPEKLECFAAMFDSLHFLDLFRQDHQMLAIKKVQFDWVLEVLVTLPDIDEIGERREYELGQLLERFGRRDLGWLVAVVNARIQMADARASDDADLFKVVPTHRRLTRYVQEISLTPEQPKSVTEHLSAMLEFARRRDMVGYIMPQYAIDVDPEGRVVPNLVASRIGSEAARDRESIYEWARFGGRYPFNSAPWREIAKAAINSARDLSERDREAIFCELMPKEFRSSSYNVGEMDPRPGQDLLARKRELEEEEDAYLMPFRQWHLKLAQAEFDQALANFKEETEQ